MHSRKFRNGTKRWRRQHRKFHPDTLMWWKTVNPNPGYLITAEELKSVLIIDRDDGTKGIHEYYILDKEN